MFLNNTCRGLFCRCFWSHTLGMRALSCPYRDAAIFSHHYLIPKAENDTSKVIGKKEREQVEIVANCGFHSDDDRIFGEWREFVGEGRKTMSKHFEDVFEDDRIRVRNGTSVELVFGNINTDQETKTYQTW